MLPAIGFSAIVLQYWTLTMSQIYKSTVGGVGVRTAKTQYRKFETNTPRKGIARPQS
jgi:hypothetical protein